jgi:hypothetical protein
MHRGTFVLGLVCLGVLTTPALAHAGEVRLSAATTGARSGHAVSEAAAHAMRYGPLPADARALAAQKRLANRASARSAAGGGLLARLLAPVSLRSWAGVFDPGGSPSDSTGAIGTSRYIELINQRFAIYNRTSDVPLSTDTLQALVGAAPTDDVFDPQVIWDATTSRFYYAADWVISAADNRIAFGFSKTSSPTTAADWCTYSVHYDNVFPDFPKLGDTAGFIFVGVNKFNAAQTYLGSDVFGVSKPANGAVVTCPDFSTFQTAVAENIHTPSGAPVFTPVPANQIDSSDTGYVIARNAALPATRLWELVLGANPDGTPNIPVVASPIVVPSYSVPANAPSPGFAQRIDTADARNTQAVLAIDPARGANAFALWTQHTVNGGAGARVRWYEINPVARTVYQTGAVAPAGLFAFNASISPDRQVRLTTARFGSNTVVNFNTSSSTSNPAIRVVSKRGAAPLSAPVLIKASAGGYADFTCANPAIPCRWGDYSAATPDPVVPSGARVGRVWGTNQWNLRGNTTGAPWRTWNFAVTP